MYKLSVMATLIAAAFSVHANPQQADLQAIRAQINEMRQTYEQRIAALEEKLLKAEAKAENAEKTAVVAAQRPAPTAPVAAATGFNPEVSLILQGQYKNMKNIAERGITGFWPAGGHDHAGGIEGINKRGFSLNHTELILAANIDPYWRGQAIIAALDGQAEVEEAWLQSLGLGQGLGLKAGRYRSGVGYLNEQHPHMWDFADAPLMYQAMFGTHGSYTQDGVQLKWLAPTPVFLEFGAEMGRGANFPGTERNKNGSGAGALFAHLGGDVGVAHSWRAGLSYLRTKATGREAEAVEIQSGNAEHVPVVFGGGSRTLIADFVWKWAPDGNPKYRNFKFQTEYFNRKESGNLSCFDNGGVCVAEDAGGTLTALDRYRRSQSGWYAQAVYQFTPNWRAGLRHEQLNSGSPRLGAGVLAQLDAQSDLFAHYKPKKTSAMVDYSWSEFSRMRLQYAHDQSMAGVTDHQWTLQYIMSLGSHGAHKF